MIKRIGAWFRGLSPAVQIVLVLAVAAIIAYSLFLGVSLTDVGKAVLGAP